MVEIDSEFTYYCTDCKTRTYTKFPKLHDADTNKAPLQLGSCRCGHSRQIWLVIREDARTNQPTVSINFDSPNIEEEDV